MLPKLGEGTGKDNSRGTHAPMQGIESERPLDPGPFQIPNKRLHTEDQAGQSHYISNPLQPSQLAPGPLLFSNSGFSRYSNTPRKTSSSSWGHDESQPELKDVDMVDQENLSVRRNEELVDIEMYSDSPTKPAFSSGNQPAPDLLTKENSESIPTTQKEEKIRPISLNGVKKELKRRIKENSTALVLRAENGANEESDGDVSFDAESDVSTPNQTPIKSRSKSRGKKSHLSTSHVPDSLQQPINQYTLNMYHAPPQAAGALGQASSGETGAKRAAWVDAELPYIFIGYVQFIFNASLTLMILAGLFWFCYTIWGDVKDLRGVYSTEILQEISTCTNKYLINRCEPAMRIPAMESACQEWEHCMNRDPSVVSFTKVGAEVVAGVLGGFVDTLSWRSLFSLFGLFPLVVIMTNSTLLSVRKKHQPVPVHHYAPAQHYAQPHGGYLPQQPGFPPQQAQFNWPPPSMSLGSTAPAEKSAEQKKGWFGSS